MAVVVDRGTLAHEGALLVFLCVVTASKHHKHCLEGEAACME